MSVLVSVNIKSSETNQGYKSVIIEDRSPFITAGISPKSLDRNMWRNVDEVDHIGLSVYMYHVNSEVDIPTGVVTLEVARGDYASMYYHKPDSLEGLRQKVVELTERLQSTEKQMAIVLGHIGPITYTDEAGTHILAET